jgi:hypothetical protein
MKKLLSILLTLLFVSVINENVNCQNAKLPNYKLEDLWKNEKLNCYVNIGSNGLAVYTSKANYTYLGYWSAAKDKKEIMSFYQKDGTYMKGYTSFRFEGENILHVILASNNSKQTLYRQANNHKLRKFDKFLNWENISKNLPYSLTGSWSSNNEIISFYGDGFWSNIFPKSDDSSPSFGVLTYEPNGLLPFKLNYDGKINSAYRIRFLSAIHFQLITKKGNILDYYKGSNTPGATISLVPSSSDLLISFLGALLSGGNSNSSYQGAYSNDPNVNRYMQGAHEQDARDAGY